MKSKLLATSLACLALVPITTISVTQTANAATSGSLNISTPVKVSPFTIYYISGEATTKVMTNFCHPDDVTGSVSVTPDGDRGFPANYTFKFDKITYIRGNAYYHIAGASAYFDWVSGSDCY
ncbi:hypothetical protein DS832_07815 [Bombilactobacillus bombi]|uniref:Uncharacterized protein n=1 Tax=Bombilactobacillus bombi TaxID=1303590 RepID=A0A3R6YIL7_9LACO|nr:hypothetical protein [Bombilactobacillus bombi]RHW45421.1 hypothetical protein DS832_07815 [Bombilactobacillus bombi]